MLGELVIPRSGSSGGGGLVGAIADFTADNTWTSADPIATLTQVALDTDVFEIADPGEFGYDCLLTKVAGVFAATVSAGADDATTANLNLGCAAYGPAPGFAAQAPSHSPMASIPLGVAGSAAVSVLQVLPIGAVYEPNFGGGQAVHLTGGGFTVTYLGPLA